MKRVLKYGTGHEVPDDAVYLCTQVETQIVTTAHSGIDAQTKLDCVNTATNTQNIFVWHYYEVKS